MDKTRSAILALAIATAGSVIVTGCDNNKTTDTSGANASQSATVPGGTGSARPVTELSGQALADKMMEPDKSDVLRPAEGVTCADSSILQAPRFSHTWCTQVLNGQARRALVVSAGPNTDGSPIVTWRTTVVALPHVFHDGAKTLPLAAGRSTPVTAAQLPARLGIAPTAKPYYPSDVKAVSCASGLSEPEDVTLCTLRALDPQYDKVALVYAGDAYRDKLGKISLGIYKYDRIDDNE